jgi:hypothetical protein
MWDEFWAIPIAKEKIESIRGKIIERFIPLFPFVCGCNT